MGPAYQPSGVFQAAAQSPAYPRSSQESPMNAWFCCLAGVLLGMSTGAPAQEYPSRPLKLIVADGPGSVGDSRSRVIAARLSEFMGQPVMVENKPGGNMAIAAQAAASSAPDGYTL